MNSKKKLKVHVAKEDIKAGLRRLGLKNGDRVGVHSSLSRFGVVDGGANAVIDALLEVVGEEGTIVMPTYSTNRVGMKLTPAEAAAGLTWKFKILPYDSNATPCWTGIIPETFRKRPSVLRSSHPTHSKAAAGRYAKEIVENEDSSALGSWKKLLELDGYILFIGIGLRACSSMHLAEERVKLPQHLAEKTTLPKNLVEKYPATQWDICYGPYPNFAKMEKPLLKKGILCKTRIGQAMVQLVKLSALIDLYAEQLRRNPDLFYR